MNGQWMAPLALGVLTARSWPAHRELANETLHGGHSTPQYKQDLLRLFRAERFASSTALDIGAGQGHTAAALSPNFALVIATETYWTLAERLGHHLDAQRLRRLDGSVPVNILRTNLDAKLPYSFGIFAEQNITAVVIDAQHDFASIVRETFAVLRYLPCCVETIVYHDYCDNEVYSSIQYFVDAGIIAPRGHVGQRSPPAWCNDPTLHSDRPEAVAMRVLRRRADVWTKLEALHRLWMSQEAFSLESVRNSLDGTKWLLVTAFKQLRLLTLGFSPTACDWRSIQDPDLSDPLGSFFRGSSAFLWPTLSDRQLPLLVIRKPGDPSLVFAELDREMQLMSLDASGLTDWGSAMGFQITRWLPEFLRLTDHFMHVDGSLSTASGAWQSALFGAGQDKLP